MADYEAPSFSLGLDLGLDSEPEIDVGINPSVKTADSASGSDQDQEEIGTDPEEEGFQPPPRILKRLRRGPSDGSSSVRKEENAQPFCDVDDDIEDFSSEDDLLEVNVHPSKQHHPVSSSSKVPLISRGILTTCSSSQMKGRKRAQISDPSTSNRLEKSFNSAVFPKLTISPIRRFQLLDSDSDSDSNGSKVNGEIHRKDHDINLHSREQDPHIGKSLSAKEQISRASTNLQPDKDLWKDFSPMRSSCIPTPAFDEVCEEFFRSTVDKRTNQKQGSDMSVKSNMGFHKLNDSFQDEEQVWDSGNPLPPAHDYFFHDDLRIRKLVRDRLSNFSPLGVVNRSHQQPNASIIDYMGQFNNRQASKQQGNHKASAERSSIRGRHGSKKLSFEDCHASRSGLDPAFVPSLEHKGYSTREAIKSKGLSKGRNRSNKPNSAEILCTSERWVEPKINASKPKDAGKRRVQASGKAMGHWYTGSDGKKVYVNKSGQEFTGQLAYRHYKKETGSGFKKSKGKVKASSRSKKG